MKRFILVWAALLLLVVLVTDEYNRRHFEACYNNSAALEGCAITPHSASQVYAWWLIMGLGHLGTLATVAWLTWRFRPTWAGLTYKIWWYAAADCALLGLVAMGLVLHLDVAYFWVDHY